MQRVTLSILSLFCLFSVSSASVCVVSFWSEWNSCVGNCQFALRVRNRNVIRPPFPERTPDGRLAIRPCPSLYQVQTCIPPPCLSANGNETAVNSIDSASIDPDVSSVQKVVEEQTERARIEKLPQNAEASSNDAVSVQLATRPPTANPAENTTPLKVARDGVAIVNEVGDERRADEQSQSVADGNEGRASVVEVVSSTHSSEIGRDTTTIQDIKIPAEPSVKAEVAVEVADPKSAKSEELITGDTPSTVAVGGHSAQTVVAVFDDNNATSVENETDAASPFDEASPLLSTEQPVTQAVSQAVTQDNLAVSTAAPELEKSAANATDEGFRRAPLTSKPLRRNTKPCGVPGGNPRCCRLSTRSECPDGEKPQSVMRWSRMAENGECHSYNYGYCGIDVELEEAPIKFEQNCYDLCFTEEEKDSLGIFRDQQFQFRDGFRIRL